MWTATFADRIVYLGGNSVFISATIFSLACVGSSMCIECVKSRDGSAASRCTTLVVRRRHGEPGHHGVRLPTNPSDTISWLTIPAVVELLAGQYALEA